MLGSAPVEHIGTYPVLHLLTPLTTSTLYPYKRLTILSRSIGPLTASQGVQAQPLP